MTPWSWFGLALIAASAAAGAQQRQEVPTSYEAGHFIATPVLEDGRALRLLVDTGGAGGGGWFVFYRSAVARLHLPARPCSLDGDHFEVVAPLIYRAAAGLPAGNDTPCGGPALVIRDGAVDHEDGQLGAGYLPGHVWTFDYPAHQLWLEPPNWMPSKDMHRVTLGFPRNAKGEPQGGLARISARIGEDTLDFLLDTGATAHPSAQGMASATELTASGIGVTSYVTTSQLERWHHAHPDWRVIDRGDDLAGTDAGTRLIEVPSVDVGGWRVGPMWFTERADVNFSASPGQVGSFMDAPIVGALGANVYRHFRMTLDYPRGNAWLACVEGCRAAPH